MKKPINDAPIFEPDTWLTRTDRLVSDGNSKIGGTMNVSLLPGITCPSRVPCSRTCYAIKTMGYAPSAMKRWLCNTMLWKQNPERFEQTLLVQIAKKKPRFFRWHVAGDIPDPAYFQMMWRVADENPKVRFLAFTKRWSDMEFPILDALDGVKNLNVVLSGWPGYDESTFWGLVGCGFPFSWVNLRKTERPTPKKCKPCPGNCETCRLCWNLKPGKGVCFEEH